MAVIRTDALLLLALAACGGKDGGTATNDSGAGGAASPAAVLEVTSEVLAPMNTVVRVSFTTDRDASGFVEFDTDGDGDFDRQTRETTGTAHEALLVALPPGSEVSWRVVVDGITGETQSSTTGALPLAVPELTVEGTGQDRFLSLAFVEDDVSTAVVVDPDGRVVWAHEDTRGLSVYRVHPLNDGSGVVYSATLIAGRPNEGSVFVKVPWDGSSETEIPVPHLAHDFVELDDGTLVSLAHEWRDDVEGNKLVSVAPDGTQADLWSAWDCFDPALHPSIDPAQGWTHGNALDYDAANDAFLVGLRNVTAIVEVDRATGDCGWILGGSAATLSLSGDRFFHQHQFQRTADGIVVFDNDGAPGFESRVLEIAIDEGAGTAEVVDRIHADPPLYSFILGDAHRLDDGDTMIVWSVPGKVDRMAADGTREWRLSAPDGVIVGFAEAWFDPARPDLGVSR